ncbi:hypothetical protein ACFL0V_02175 [Nanoarchaeota archaeon]
MYWYDMKRNKQFDSRSAAEAEGFHWNTNNTDYCELSHCHKWVRYGAGFDPREYGLEDFEYCEICGMPKDPANH